MFDKSHKVCPRGHVMEKKQDFRGNIATRCRKMCQEFKNCKFDHNIDGCYWCLKCGKHYLDAWSIS